VKNLTQHANRGKYLEDWIEQANQIYNAKGLAVINKIPTPWKIQRNFQPFTKQYTISHAYPDKKSTVDFGGTAQKYSVWFDVKATTNKTSFPLKNIHDHQIEYLEKVAAQGGKAFLIVHFRELNKTWLLWIDQLFKFIGEMDRKSIPVEWFQENCEEVRAGNSVTLDYLPIVLRRNDG
jgi:recombination protein U